MSKVDGEAVAGCGILSCGCFVMGCAVAVLAGLVVLVWRFALGV